MRRLRWRWPQVFSHLFLAIVALWVAQHAISAALRWKVNRSGGDSFAKVEVDEVRLSLLKRSLSFGGLRVVDSRNPDRVLCEADDCLLNVQVGPLLQKQIVVDGGSITGLRLGTRASSGEADESTAAGNLEWTKQASEGLARQWLAELALRFDRAAATGFGSLRRTEAFCARWPAQRDQLRERAATLEARAQELQQATLAAEANPLRNADFFRTLPNQIAFLRRDFDGFAQHLDKCAANVDSERRAIVAVRQQDEEAFRKKLQVPPVDANSLTAYLLRDQLRAPLNELVDWLGCLHRAAPAGGGETNPRTRGEDILFGRRPVPNLLVRAIEVRGTAHYASRAFGFRGQLTDLANAPGRHTAPMRLKLASTSGPPIECQITIDRTQLEGREELLVDCRGLAMPPVSLGDSEELAFQLGPSVAAISISVSISSDALRGDVQVVHNDVQVTPIVEGSLSNLALAAPLRSTLGKLNSVATRVSLEGTLDAPCCTLWSNLGPAAAEALHRAAQSAVEHHAQQVVVDARRHVDEQLANLERQLSQERSRHAAQITQWCNRLETIAARQAPRDRITIEQLGRQLPESSLLR